MRIDARGRALRGALAALLCANLVAACGRTRYIAPTSPTTVGEYVRTHPRAVLRVTDSTGRSHWLYEASVSGDTLQGFPTQTPPRRAVAVPFSALQDVSSREFSVKRTGIFLGALAGAVYVFALLLAPPQAVY